MTPEKIEALAIRAAKGNNGGEWATHYNEDQKNVWRAFAGDLIRAAENDALERAAVDTEEIALMYAKDGNGPYESAAVKDILRGRAAAIRDLKHPGSG